jgi:PAS domain S-box-containing protein
MANMLQKHASYASSRYPAASFERGDAARSVDGLRLFTLVSALASASNVDADLGGSGQDQTPGPASSLFSTLLDTLPVMIWTSDSAVGRQYFNQAWLSYRGRSLQEETGSGWLKGVHPDDVESSLESYEASYQKRTLFQAQYRLRRHDQADRWVSDTAVPWVSPAGVFLGYAGACVDIHSSHIETINLRVANDDLSRNNEELKQYAYGASHDLLEPLRTIDSYTALLARQSAGREGDEFLRFVFAAVGRMRALIDGLLNYGRIQDSAAQMVAFDPKAALEQAVLACHASIEETGAVVTHGPLPLVCVDQKQFVQLLQNLVSNSIKYRRSGEPPRVHLSATDTASQVVFTMTDNGIGFDARYAEYIFQSFKRLHAEREYQGNGLGLAICRKIVERHGGRIWAQSEPGLGAKFFFTLPRA